MRAANVTWQGIDLTDVKEMDFTPDELETYRLQDSDILLSEASGSPSEVGKPAIWRNQIADCCLQNTLVRVRARSDALAPFLHLHFLRDAMTGRFAAASRGVGIHHLGAEALVNWNVDLPPVNEQARIREAVDSYLSRLDAAVESLSQAQTKLKAYRASVLKAAVEGRLVPPEAELAKAEGRTYEPADKLLERILRERRRAWEERQLADMKAKGKEPRDDKWKAKYQEPTRASVEMQSLPNGWCWARLGELMSLVTSGSRGWGDYYSDTGPLFIRAQDIKTDKLERRSIARVSLPESAEGLRTLVSYGDLLVTITGANVTKTAWVAHVIEEAYVSQHVALCRPVVTALSPYLHTWTVAPTAGRRALEAVAYGAGKPGLNLENIRDLLVALPPIPEQTRIMTEVERLLSIADGCEDLIQTLRMRCARLRQSILKAAFEGQLVDQDPNDEPASELLARLRATPEPTAKPKRGRKPKTA